MQLGSRYNSFGNNSLARIWRPAEQIPAIVRNRKQNFERRRLLSNDLIFYLLNYQLNICETSIWLPLASVKHFAWRTRSLLLLQISMQG